MRRGQLTIEFIAVLAVILLMFAGVTRVLMDNSLHEASELSILELFMSDKMLLDNTVDALLEQGTGARKTVYVRAPAECDLYFAYAGGRLNLYCPDYPIYHCSSDARYYYQLPPGPAWDCLTCATANVGGANYHVVEAGTVAPIIVLQQ